MVYEYIIALCGEARADGGGNGGSGGGGSGTQRKKKYNDDDKWEAERKSPAGGREGHGIPLIW